MVLLHQGHYCYTPHIATLPTGTSGHARGIFWCYVHLLCAGQGCYMCGSVPHHKAFTQTKRPIAPVLGNTDSLMNFLSLENKHFHGNHVQFAYSVTCVCTSEPCDHSPGVVSL